MKTFAVTLTVVDSYYNNAIIIPIIDLKISYDLRHTYYYIVRSTYQNAGIL